MAIQFVTGQRLTADLMNANIYDFMPVTTGKTSTTARTSTTTLADDPELAGIALAAGVWEVELRGFFTVAANQAVKTRWGFSGTATDANRLCIGLGAGNVAQADAGTTVTAVGRGWQSQDAVYGKLSGATYGGFREIVSELVVTVAGNLSLQWAQNASSASATSIMMQSAFLVRKVR